MTDIDEMVGKKFGRLTVLHPMVERDKQGRMRYLCKCDCGERVAIRGSALRSGNSKSCGCIRSEKARERMQKKIERSNRWST